MKYNYYPGWFQNTKRLFFFYENKSYYNKQDKFKASIL